MDIKLALNPVAIAKIQGAILPAAKATIDALKTEVVSAHVMPFAVGTMQNTQTFVSTIQEGDEVSASLVTDAPQARRLYYHPEYNFRKSPNKNAGGEWLDPWINGEKKDFVKKSFVENYKKEAGI